MNAESEVNSNIVTPAAVEVFYGDCQMVPAPLIDWTVEGIFNDVGEREANRNRLTLTGTVLIVPSGSYEKMYVKQEELRQAFSIDEQDFVILAGPGNCTLPEGTIICSGLRPRINSVNIPPDLQFQRIDYTIEMEDTVPASGVSGVTSSFSNQWSFQEDPNTCTLNVSHTVNAEGPEGESDKFQQAVRAVKAVLGIENMPIELPCFTEPNASGGWGITHPSNPAGGPIFEVSHQREESADVANGTYSVVETFQIVSGVPFFFSARNESFDEDVDGIATVTVAGQVQGLGRTLVQEEPDGGLGFARACSGWLNCVRPLVPEDAAEVYDKYKTNNTGSGLSLQNPQSISISQNRCQGTIDFSYTYTDDPSAFLPSGIASRQCTVNLTDSIRLFASFGIPFRRLGPLIQDIKTTTEGAVSLVCNVTSKNTGNPTLDTNRAIQFVEDELNRLREIYADPAEYITLRIASLTQNNSDTELTASATISYAFTQDLGSAPSVNSDISLRKI